MNDKEIEAFITNIGSAREAILSDLTKRHASGDKSVILNKRSRSMLDDPEYAAKNYLSGVGEIACPICKTGKLRYSRASYNGHVLAACSNDNCVRWME